MPSVTLNFTAAKGLRFMEAVKAHSLSPLTDPAGEPHTELQLLKQGLIVLVAREVHAFEQGQAMQIAHAVMDEAENSVQIDDEIAS